MPELNENFPETEVYVRADFLRGLNPEFSKQWEPCLIFGVSAIPEQPILFHIQLPCGAVFSRLPIVALAWKNPPTEQIPLDFLNIWNCPSSKLVVHPWNWLQGQRCAVLMKDRKWREGTYLTTVDFYGSREAEAAADIGWKCGHIVQLDNGLYAASPNNRMTFYEPSYVTEKFPKKPTFDVLPHTFDVENTDRKWLTTEGYFYDFQKRDE